MKSIAFLGLLSTQVGFEGKFSSFVLRYKLFSKFIGILESSSNLRVLSQVSKDLRIVELVDDGIADRALPSESQPSPQQ